MDALAPIGSATQRLLRRLTAEGPASGVPI